MTNGFQLDQSENWLEYPYILVQVRRSGRIPYSQLKSLRKVKDAFSDEMKKTQDLMSSIVSSWEIGEPLYDSSSHILWTQIAMDVNEVGRVKALSAVLLTDFGAIQIIGTAKANDFNRFAPVFEAIAKNAILSDTIKYEPRLTDSLPVLSRIDWGEVLIKAIVMGVLGVIVALIAGMRRIKARRG